MRSYGLPFAYIKKKHAPAYIHCTYTYLYKLSKWFDINPSVLA